MGLCQVVWPGMKPLSADIISRDLHRRNPRRGEERSRCASLECLAQEVLLPPCLHGHLFLDKSAQPLHVCEAGIWRHEAVALLMPVREAWVEDVLQHALVDH